MPEARTQKELEDETFRSMGFNPNWRDNVILGKDLYPKKEIKETDPMKTMIANHPEAMTGELKKIKLSWVVGQGYSFMLSESYLGGFLMEPIRIILRIKYWFKERTKKNA